MDGLLGRYNKVPIMLGFNKNEGLLIKVTVQLLYFPFFLVEENNKMDLLKRYHDFAFFFNE